LRYCGWCGVHYDCWE